MTRGDRHHVVIAGGGVAALEAVLALRALAGHRVRITLIAPEHDFIYRPVTVAEAFDHAQARSYDLPQLTADLGIELLCDELVLVEPESATVLTGAGHRLAFDSLLIATGCKAHEALPGALTFRGRQDVPALRELLAELVDGRISSVAFALPAEHSWPLPLYELALLTAGHLRSRGAAGARVTVVTSEQAPLGLFGDAATPAIEALLAVRGIAVRANAIPIAVDTGALILQRGEPVPADRVVALPLMKGPRLPGLPHDDAGFIPVDAHARVKGEKAIYAAGDVTDSILKQGGLATQQADAAAEMIAAGIGLPIVPAPSRPVLRGLLMTGGPPLYLRSDQRRVELQGRLTIWHAEQRLAARATSAAAGQPLWWPPAKIAGRYLAPYLSQAQRVPGAETQLTDRQPVDGPPVSAEEHRDALELALLLANCDANWGDYRSALAALDAAEALEGALPPEYEDKRSAWRREVAEL